MDPSAQSSPSPLPGDASLSDSDSQAQLIQRSVSNAILQAMGSMSTVLSQTISQALSAHPLAGARLAPPEIAQHSFAAEPPVGQETMTGVLMTTPDDALRSRKRACPRQADKSRVWKHARALADAVSDSDLGSGPEVPAEATDFSEEDDSPLGSDPIATPPAVPLTKDSSSASADNFPLDSSGAPMFDPEALHHPRSAEWLPDTQISSYLEHWARRPLSKEARSKLRAECPRPIIPHKVCDTPVVDPKMTQFLSKSGWNAKRGLDSALRGCQDKLLDIFGPLAKIMELAESARQEGSHIDPEELTGWAQRAICIAGGANASLSVERRKAILLRIDPKLINLAQTETGKEAEGLLFGDSFIKDLSRFVGTFSALDKAQATMRKVFQGRVSHRAGSNRGRLSGRSSTRGRGVSRGSFSQRAAFQDQRSPQTFFPSRGGQWRSRSFRGNTAPRKSFG
ncbi:uncharacterized protein LOC122935173 [Bufo gargarizans]|uniref:uncharacterized protein LOC122935173 n=1 Tax=Bufo gargarizans TaxID=30331 RepID=UPI001CF47635|nr:uncharacterized protein LOC122935173 [Bufo gargarizans]